MRTVRAQIPCFATRAIALALAASMLSGCVSTGRGGSSYSSAPSRSTSVASNSFLDSETPAPVSREAVVPMDDSVAAALARFYDRSKPRTGQGASRSCAYLPLSNGLIPTPGRSNITPVQGFKPGGNRWTAQNHADAVAAADEKKFPDLLGITGKNMMGGLCTNFLTDFTLEQRKVILAKTVMSLGWAESNFRASERGDETLRSREEGGGDINEAKGVFQLADNTRRGFGCEGDLIHAGPSSIDCVYRIFNRKGVVNPKTHWSVLMPNRVVTWKEWSKKEQKVVTREITHPMENRFMPTFKAYVPECKSIHAAENIKSTTPPPVSYVGTAPAASSSPAGKI